MKESAHQMPRWNWFWLAPSSVLVFIMVEQHTFPFALQVVRLSWQRWNWGGLFSPSAYFCWSVIVASVITPIQGLLYAVALVSSRTDLSSGAGRRYLQALLVFVVVLLLPFVTDALIWGSFPFTFDSAGVGRLRLIPFIPWPNAPFGTY
jgi:hypothetical protein